MITRPAEYPILRCNDAVMYSLGVIVQVIKGKNSILCAKRKKIHIGNYAVWVKKLPGHSPCNDA
eukprot:13740854-Ditylum_brightwellii.AAC.1